MTAISAKIKQQVFKVSGFAVIFGLVKLNSFTAALFLSNIITDAADYGLFEYALSLGLILAIPLDLGLQVAYPFFNLKLRQRGYRSLFFLHALLISGSVIAFVGGQLLLGFLVAEKWLFVLLIAGIIFSQSLLSSILKSSERIFLAVLVDGGLFIFLNIYNAYLWSLGIPFDFQLLNSLFLAYLGLFFCINLYWFIKTKSDFSSENYKKAIEYGQPILVAAFLIIWLTGGARVFIEYFLGLELVGIYAFYLRLTGVMLMLSQIINIVFFKKIYVTKPAILDNWFVLFISGIFLIGVIIFKLVPILLGDYFQILNQSWSTYHPLFLLLNFHMIFWITMALYENVMYREQLAAQMNRWFFGLILLMTGLFILFYSFAWLDLFTLVIINATILFLATEIQNYLLAVKKHIFLKKTRITTRILVGLLLCYTLTILN